MLVAPAAWAGSVLDTSYAGSSFNASAGPVSMGGGGAGGMMGATTALSSSEQQIYRYVSAHRDGASYPLAVSSWIQASPYIEATGQEVMPMGGFGGGGPGGARGSTASTIESWVESNCRTVPAEDYAGSATSTGTLYACSSGS